MQKRLEVTSNKEEIGSGIAIKWTRVFHFHFPLFTLRRKQTSLKGLSEKQSINKGLLSATWSITIILPIYFFSFIVFISPPFLTVASKSQLVVNGEKIDVILHWYCITILEKPSNHFSERNTIFGFKMLACGFLFSWV